MLAHAGSLKALGFNDSGTKSFWRDFFAKAFHPYRPELHYMSGPGPAWRAKYGEAAYRLKCRVTSFVPPLRFLCYPRENSIQSADSERRRQVARHFRR